MVDLYTAGRRSIATQRPDSRLAELLVAQALKPQTAPIQSTGEGAANAGTRIVNAYLGKQLFDKADERDRAASDTVAQALRAGQPWRTPDPVEGGTMTVGESTVPDPSRPALAPGAAFPGTGGAEAMIAALSKNRDTAPMALKMAVDRNIRADQLADAIAKLRAGENVYMQGRGSPAYQERLASARREPVDEAAARAAAKAEAELPARKDLAAYTARTKAEADTGQTERLVSRLMKEDPNLSYRDALVISKYAPRQDADNLRRERMALDAAKEDPDWGLNQFKTLQLWRDRYGLSPMKTPPEAKKEGAKTEKSWWQSLFGGGGKKAIPDAAVAHLKQNPSLAKDFDAKYGEGAAAKALGR